MFASESLSDIAMECGVPHEVLRAIIEPFVASRAFDVTQTSILTKGQGRAVVSLGGRNQGVVLKLDRCHDRIFREAKCLRKLNASPVKEHFPRLEAHESVPDGDWSYLLQERVNGNPLSRITGDFDCLPLIEQMIEVQSAVASEPHKRNLESVWLESLVRFAETRLTSLLRYGIIDDSAYQRANKVNEELLAAQGSFPLLPIHGDLKPEHVYLPGQANHVKCRFVDLADATFGDVAWDVAVLTLENDQWMRVAVTRMNNNIKEAQPGFSRRVEFYRFIRTACNVDYAREFGLPMSGLLHSLEERLRRLR